MPGYIIGNDSRGKPHWKMIAGPSVSDEMREQGKDEMTIEIESMTITWVPGPGWDAPDPLILIRPSRTARA